MRKKSQRANSHRLEQKVMKIACQNVGLFQTKTLCFNLKNVILLNKLFFRGEGRLELWLKNTKIIGE